jgi:hypothetical protein
MASPMPRYRWTTRTRPSRLERGDVQGTDRRHPTRQVHERLRLLCAFISQYGPEYGNLMAAAVMVALPPVVLFVLLQRHLIGGLTAGAVKH